MSLFPFQLKQIDLGGFFMDIKSGEHIDQSVSSWEESHEYVF